MAEVRNRLGYGWRKVRKAKPPQKINETAAIFDNRKKKTNR